MSSKILKPRPESSNHVVQNLAPDHEEPAHWVGEVHASHFSAERCRKPAHLLASRVPVSDGAPKGVSGADRDIART